MTTFDLFDSQCGARIPAYHGTFPSDDGICANPTICADCGSCLDHCGCVDYTDVRDLRCFICLNPSACIHCNNCAAWALDRRGEHDPTL